jgi:cytochrome bd-type quinol oxidase subunit 1
MSIRRLEVLQWFALFAGPWAWATQHVLEFGVSNSDCSVAVASWNVPTTVLHTIVALACGAVVVAAEVAAYLVYRATADVDEYAPGPYGRLRFFAEAALLGNALFLGIVLLDVAGALTHSCRQA